MKSIDRRYVAVLIALVATWIASSTIRALPPVARFAAELDTIPIRMADWQGQDEPLGKDVLAALGGDSVLYRTYTDLTTGSHVGLHVVYRKTNRRVFYHRPEACYPAAGWTITASKPVRVYYVGRDVTATEVTVERDGMRQVVVYWFASGRRTESTLGGQQIRMVLDRLSPSSYGWSFIRLDSAVDSTEEETLERIRAFARVISNPLFKVQTGKQQLESADP